LVFGGGLGGVDEQGKASQRRRVVHNWGKKRVEKQIPPCLYYQTQTPSIIFHLKIITPSYTQRDELKLGLHSDIHL
jgi:hypothetical protein